MTVIIAALLSAAAGLVVLAAWVLRLAAAHRQELLSLGRQLRVRWPPGRCEALTVGLRPAGAFAVSAALGLLVITSCAVGAGKLIEDITEGDGIAVLAHPVARFVGAHRAMPLTTAMRAVSRWHAAFAAVPDPVPGPGTGEIVGMDRGVAVPAALSTGEMLTVPGLTGRERGRLARLQRKLARAQRGSDRRGKVKTAIAKLTARESDRRKDWAEKTSTGRRAGSA